MADQKFIKYGDKTMAMPDSMTLDDAKKQMARIFPELAEPDVKTEKKNDKTIYVFSKKAGRKGADGSAGVVTLNISEVTETRLEAVFASICVQPGVQGVMIWRTGDHWLGCLIDKDARQILNSTTWNAHPSIVALLDRLVSIAENYAALQK